MSRKRPIWTKPVFISQENHRSSPEEPPKKRLSSSQSTLSSTFTSNSCNATQNNSLLSNSATNLKQKLTEYQINSSNWIDNFAPQTIDDLAVHTKKIDEIQNWLKHCEFIKNKCSDGQITLITGPAGSGKTAAVRVIAKEMQYEVIEWISPLDLDLMSLKGEGDTITYKESQVDIFQRFLFRSSRYNSVFQSFEKKIVLVEDFPHVFLKNSDGFNEILQRYKLYGRSPLIFIVTDSKRRNLNLSYNLFSDQIRSEFQISSISFNPVSTTLMKKALKRIASLMNQAEFSKFYKIPSPDIIDSISLTALGDIRNAVINFHFASLKGAPQIQLKNQNLTSKSEKAKSKNNKILASVGQDESITLMHALGRVFNPKFSQEVKRVKFLHSPEDITDSFSSEPKKFVDFIFANYLTHFATIDNVLGAIDCISQSDILMTEYREDQIGVLGLHLAVRGVMVNNERPVSAWLPIKGPKKYKEEYNYQMERKNYGIKENISKNVIARDYRTYAKIINNK